MKIKLEEIDVPDEVVSELAALAPGITWESLFFAALGSLAGQVDQNPLAAMMLQKIGEADAAERFETVGTPVIAP